MAKLPQAEIETTHYFADGMYARALFRKAGTLIVGKIHKREHFYIIAMGKVKVTTDDGVETLSAGTVIVSKPGTKRAVYALEDSLCVTVHRNHQNTRDLKKLEKRLIVPEANALFNASNKLKALK